MKTEYGKKKISGRVKYLQKLNISTSQHQFNTNQKKTLSTI